MCNTLVMCSYIKSTEEFLQVNWQNHLQLSRIRWAILRQNFIQQLICFILTPSIFFFVLQSYLLTNFNNSKKMLEFHSRKATSIQFLVNLVRKTPVRCEQWLLLKRWMWTLQLAVVSSEWGGIFKLKGEERKALRNFLWGFSFPFYAYALCS